MQNLRVSYTKEEMEKLKSNYGRAEWQQEVLGEFDRADAMALAMNVGMLTTFDEAAARRHGINQLEKAVKEDMCRKCMKSIREGIRINDVVTIHRIMGEYWIYHTARFEEMAGPDSVPPQKNMVPSSRNEDGLRDDKSMGLRAGPASSYGAGGMGEAYANMRAAKK